MAEPATTLGLVVGKAAASHVGALAGRQMLEWIEGSEAKRLVKLLEKQHPAAYKMTTQPDVLGHLWLYAETGDLDLAGLTTALRAITDDEAEAVALAEAVRDTQWRAVRDERRTHFEVRRLRAELAADTASQTDEIVARLDAILARLGRALPVSRQLPAAPDLFVDREVELRAAMDVLAAPPPQGVARVISLGGMPGIGKSALALEIARRCADQFAGGVLYIDMRAGDGGSRPASDAAASLLRNLGVAPDAIGADSEALLRSVLADEAVIMVLDNAVDEQQVRGLLPVSGDSLVIITSPTLMAGLGQAQLLTVDEFADADALTLLAGFVGDRAAAEPGAAQTIAEACHGLPLAVSVLGARLRRQPGRALATFASELDGTIAALDDPSRTVTATLKAGLAGASPAARRVLLLVAVLDVRDLSPENVAELAGLTAAKARIVLEELRDRRLLGHAGPHQLLASLLIDLASNELTDHDLSSARERRVKRLVDSAQPHIDKLGG